MAAIPANALLGQFAEQITPATKAVFGLNAQPFAPDYGAVPGEVQDPGRGNVNVTLARKAALQTECRRRGLDVACTTATLRAAIQRANTHVMTQIGHA